jgi:peroxiredoxin Q/BCP
MSLKRIPKLIAGKTAPEIILEDQDGKTVKLSDYRGKKVILYFYPKDDTTGCTAQSCDLRDHYSKLRRKGYEVIGISNDGVKSHFKFASKYDLPFHLLADIDKKTVQDYDVYGEKMLYGRTYMGIHRTTFIIDEKGVIEEVITDVDTKAHTEQILNADKKES